MAGATDDDANPVQTDGGRAGVLAEQPVRPVGAWVVAGFLLFATLTMWTLVAVVFHARS